MRNNCGKTGRGTHCTPATSSDISVPSCRALLSSLLCSHSCTGHVLTMILFTSPSQLAQCTEGHAPAPTPSLNSYCTINAVHKGGAHAPYSPVPWQGACRFHLRQTGYALTCLLQATSAPAWHMAALHIPNSMFTTYHGFGRIPCKYTGMEHVIINTLPDHSV